MALLKTPSGTLDHQQFGEQGQGRNKGVPGIQAQAG